MDVDGPIEYIEVPVPDIFEQSFAAADASLGPSQGFEQVEFDRCQDERLVTENSRSRFRHDT
jgi:hypothetical protein